MSHSVSVASLSLSVSLSYELFGMRNSATSYMSFSCRFVWPQIVLAWLPGPCWKEQADAKQWADWR